MVVLASGWNLLDGQPNSAGFLKRKNYFLAAAKLNQCPHSQDMSRGGDGQRGRRGEENQDSLFMRLSWGKF